MNNNDNHTNTNTIDVFQWGVATGMIRTTRKIRTDENIGDK